MYPVIILCPKRSVKGSSSSSNALSIKELQAFKYCRRKVTIFKVSIYIFSFFSSKFIYFVSSIAVNSGELTERFLNGFVFEMFCLSHVELRLRIDVFMNICDVLCDLVPFAQFKKREKHPWRSVTLSKVAG